MEEEISTEQKIMDAAEHEFLEEGFSGARMQQIADKAGINKALLHYYFRSKDKLFELVVQHKIKQFIPEVNSVMHDPAIPIMDKLDRFVVGYLNMLRKNPRLPLFMLNTMHRNPDLTPFGGEKIGKQIATVLRQEMERGTIRTVDANQFMLTLTGMCIFPFLARPVFRNLFDVDNTHYDQMIAERHIHVMDYIHSILKP